MMVTTMYLYDAYNSYVSFMNAEHSVVVYVYIFCMYPHQKICLICACLKTVYSYKRFEYTVKII